MLIFDAVICSTDRHFGGLGFIVDNDLRDLDSRAAALEGSVRQMAEKLLRG